MGYANSGIGYLLPNKVAGMILVPATEGCVAAKICCAMLFH